MDDRHNVYIGFGANLGDRQATLRAARDRLAPGVEIVRCSSLYATPPWGVVDQPSFLNAVCAGRTALAPADLLAHVQQIEATLGRTRTKRWGPRLIDLDVLLYDDLVLATPALTIPHAHLHERAFVLYPLAEIAPHVRHPQLARSITELAAAVPAPDITIVARTW